MTGTGPRIFREWAMPNPQTFRIPPIRRLVERWTADASVIVDPFANNSGFGTITNDLDPRFETDYHMDATEFLRQMGDESADFVLYDPPYSPRQVAECYARLGKTVSWRDTTSAYWGAQKREIARILRPGGGVITCAWNSSGIGRGLGFDLVEVLLVAHGGWHNDTIVTVERKRRPEPRQPGLFDDFLSPDGERLKQHNNGENENG